MDMKFYLCSRCSLCGWIKITCTFIILPAVLRCSIYSPYIVPECTLAGQKQLHWGLLCPPQCGYADTLSVTDHSTAAIFSGLSPAAKTLGRKKWDMKKENKEHDWWLSLILFSATPEWMIANYLWLSVLLRSNCSFCTYLTGDICLNCPFGANLQTPLSEDQMFFCLQEDRCNYFCNVCLAFSV